MFSNPDYGEVNGGELLSLQFFYITMIMMNIDRCMLANAVCSVCICVCVCVSVCVCVCVCVYVSEGRNAYLNPAYAEIDIECN